MQTRQKRRILPDTMIQEIGRSVKCQKLNKFISRTPKLSVNKPNPCGGQLPGDPRWLSGHAGTFYPLTAPPAGRKFLQIRAARHTATIHSSLFTILFPLAPPGGTPHPGIPHPTSRERQRIAPRRGFPISWGYDKISAGAVGARFYTNKSGAKENHLCRELWVWPGRPLQNMI